MDRSGDTMPLKWLLRMFDGAPASPPPGPAVPVSAAETWHGRLMILLAEAVGIDPGREEAAAREVRDVVQRMDARQWVRTDEAMRRWLWMYEVNVRAVRVAADAEAAVVGLLAAHPNGYVREAAVQRLALVRGGDEMPP